MNDQTAAAFVRGFVEARKTTRRDDANTYELSKIDFEAIDKAFRIARIYWRDHDFVSAQERLAWDDLQERLRGADSAWVQS